MLNTHCDETEHVDIINPCKMPANSSIDFVLTGYKEILENIPFTENNILDDR